MLTLISYGLQEKLRNKSFYITSILCSIIITLLISKATITLNGAPMDSFELLLIIALGLVSLLSAILTISLSSNTIPNELERRTCDLILCRKISTSKYFLCLTLSNFIITTLSTFIVSTSLIAIAYLKGFNFSMIDTIISIMIIIAVNLFLSSLCTLLSIKLPSFANLIVTLIVYFLGAGHSFLTSSFEALKIPMKLIPNIFECISQSYNLILNNSITFKPLVILLVFILIPLASTLIIKGVKSYV